MTDNGKVIVKRKQSPLARLLRSLKPANWCLRRSKIIYAIASRCLPGEVRINIAMRCRNQTTADWGHAWVSVNGTPLLEYNKAFALKEKTKIKDTGKYIYWIYN